MLSNTRSRLLPVVKRSYAVTDSSFEKYLAMKDAKANTQKVQMREKNRYIAPEDRVHTFYHLFEQHIALTDGSVIKRYSQFPRKRIVSLQDIKSNVIYNPYRPDLAQKKATSSSIDKFKEKFRLANGTNQAEDINVDPTQTDGEFDYDNLDDFLDLLGSTNVNTLEKGEAIPISQPTPPKAKQWYEKIKK